MSKRNDERREVEWDGIVDGPEMRDCEGRECRSCVGAD